jgi:hypothetical protein
MTTSLEDLARHERRIDEMLRDLDDQIPVAWQFLRYDVLRVKNTIAYVRKSIEKGWDT